ncbi:MAG: YggS family pyridoxal phosphate-dependent enzyme [Treponema sp.]|nr:YggS family pyridoxal phosphate-dependent enzyme [Treponema sp.]
MVKENLLKVLNDIREIEKSCGRKEGSVKLLAVSKFHSYESVIEAFNAGQLAFGENRVQEADEKFAKINEELGEGKTELHIIGSLQRNKVKTAVKIASVIESVDRIELLQEIEKQCAKIDKKIKVLFELHTGEDSKSGFPDVESLKAALQYCADGNCPHVIPFGFMTMAPFTSDEAVIRKSFSSLRETAELLSKEYPEFSMKELSMGMSGDYRIAIEEGSTEVRIGTAIFGERDYSQGVK